MKITKKQLKQIIREELQREGIFDKIANVFRGKNEDYEDYVDLKLEFFLKRLSKKLSAVEFEMDNNPPEPKLEALKDLRDEIFEKLDKLRSFKLNNTEQQRDRGEYYATLWRYIKRIEGSEREVYSEQAAAKRRELEAYLEKERAKEEAYLEKIKRAEEEEKARISAYYKGLEAQKALDRKLAKLPVDDSADSYLRRHESKKKTGSKLTKEAIKQIIREEIKKAKGSK